MRCPEFAVGAIILNRRDEMLLITSGKWKGSYVVPGGHVKAGETLEHALKREIMEETGLSAEVMEFLEIQEHVFSEKVSPDRHFLFADFLCRVQDDRVRLDNREATGSIWILPGDALKMENLGYATRKLVTRYMEKVASGAGEKFHGLYAIAKKLRKECPWDMEQTIESLRPDLLDEAAEAAAAIDNKDMSNLKEEIGDVMFNLLLMSAIAEEKGQFAVEDVLQAITDKMIRRHPHIFGDLKGKSLTKEEILDNWKKIKAIEKKNITQEKK